MLSQLSPPADLDEIANKKVYAINSDDFQIISYVKNFLENRTYNEPFTVESHLISLDSIRKHLSFISVAETRSGRTNWKLMHQITELKELIEELRSIKSGLLGKLNQI